MSELRLAVDRGVATITLAASERRNALTGSLARELIAACEKIDADEAIGAVVITGEGESFCSGAVRDILSRATEDPFAEPNRTDLVGVYESFARVGRLEPPTIAAVAGAAVGAGLNLALSTDLRIVAHDARLLGGFLRLGIHPGGGHLTLLGRLAGRESAAAIGIFGEEIDGSRAFDLGLAWEAVPREQVLPRATELALRVARDPELARAAAASLRLELGPPAISWDAALQAEAAAQAWSLRRAHGKLFS